MTNEIYKRIWRYKYWLAVVCLLICGIVAIGYWERWAKDEYINDYRVQFLKIATDLNTAITNPGSDKLAQLNQSYSEIRSSIDSYCDNHSQIKWQNFFGDFKAQMDVCLLKKQKIIDFLSQLGRLIDYLQFEQKSAASVLEAHKKTTEANESGKYDEIEAYWRHVGDFISKNNGFDELKIVLVEKVNLIADVWKKLSDANVAQDKKAFDDARASIQAAYEGLQDATSVESEKVTKLIKDIDTAYKDTFSESN